MWLDLRKAGFHAHNGRPHFSLSINSLTNILTFHACLSAKALLVCFCQGLFCRPSDVLMYVGGHKNALACQNRKTTGWEWPHDWIVISAIDLATFCGIYSTTGPQLGPITITVKFCVKLTPSQAPTRLPWAGLLVVLVKNCLKWRKFQLAGHWRLCQLQDLV